MRIHQRHLFHRGVINHSGESLRQRRWKGYCLIKLNQIRESSKKRDEAPKLLEKEEEKKKKRTHKRLRKRSRSKGKYEFSEEQEEKEIKIRRNMKAESADPESVVETEM